MRRIGFLWIAILVKGSVAACVIGDKPRDIGCIAWIQELERRSDAAKRRRDITCVQDIRREIGATMTGKYGISDKPATPAERDIIFSSIQKNTDLYRGRFESGGFWDLYYFGGRQSSFERDIQNPLYQRHVKEIMAVHSLRFLAPYFETTQFLLSQSFSPAQMAREALQLANKAIQFVLGEGIQATFSGVPLDAPLLSRKINNILGESLDLNVPPAFAGWMGQPLSRPLKIMQTQLRGIAAGGVIPYFGTLCKQASNPRQSVPFSQDSGDDNRYRFLSNYFESGVHYPCTPVSPVNFSIVYGEVPFRNTEALFQGMKVALHARRNQEDSVLRAFSAYTPDQSKGAARSQYRFQASDGEALNRIMVSVVFAKFFGNRVLANALLQTGDAFLVEGNLWKDDRWGFDRERGEGENKLGKILMVIRAALQKMQAQNANYAAWLSEGWGSDDNEFFHTVMYDSQG